MFTEDGHLLGGLKIGLIKREKAINDYYVNPNICKNCLNIIEVGECQKVCDVREKQFCNHKCAASFNNRKRGIKIKEKAKRIELPKFNFLINLTKKQIFENHKNWQSARTSIRRHANYVFDLSEKPKICCECGYEKHVEICHIKGVSDFSDDSPILEINSINNLIALCPTHHWEFDNKILHLQLN